MLKYSSGDEEADLREREAKGEDTKDHIAFELRRLAHWATINSWAIGSGHSSRVRVCPLSRMTEAAKPETNGILIYPGVP